MDLSVMAGDLGAHIRMDEQNTPFVDDPCIKSLEDYEKLEVPDVTKGRSNVLVKGTGMFVKELASQVITAAFLEGPLLALTQSRGAEFVFKDMYESESSRAAVHKALHTITEYDKEMVKAFAQEKPAGLVWDYLWGSYSCLGDTEYNEFEGQHKYAGCLNELVVKEGMANCVHNCADLPHLDTQVKQYKSTIYSMAYYPLIPGSPTAKEVIAKGYADNCLMAGNIDPQGYIRWTPEKMQKTTMAAGKSYAEYFVKERIKRTGATDVKVKMDVDEHRFCDGYGQEMKFTNWVDLTATATGKPIIKL